MKSESTLPTPDADADLGDVVMMTWTTRSGEGLIGHATEAGNQDPFTCRAQSSAARWREPSGAFLPSRMGDKSFVDLVAGPLRHQT
jgi:hypothetical protein